MALAEQQLGQLRPANTTAASIYSPGVGVTTIVKTIILCEVLGGAATFRIFHDDDGTTYDEDSALYWDSPIAANQTIEISTFIAMDDSNGNLAVRTDTADAINFTVYGAEIT